MGVGAEAAALAALVVLAGFAAAAGALAAIFWLAIAVKKFSAVWVCSTVAVAMYSTRYCSKLLAFFGHSNSSFGWLMIEPHRTVVPVSLHVFRIETDGIHPVWSSHKRFCSADSLPPVLMPDPSVR